MFQPDYAASVPLVERLRAGLGRRAVAITVALLVELLLILAIWSLSQSRDQPKIGEQIVSTFDAGEDKAEEEAKPEQKAEEAKPTPQKPADPSEVTPTPPQPVPVTPQPVPSTPPFIPISPKEMQQADITAPPKAKAVIKPGGSYGPAAPSASAGDSKRVGTAPDGQPMYAAAWYRKPYQSELSGFLSTAQGPGWGLIACKTAPDFRVEDCVAIDEEPSNSNYARAVLAASWQFRVRPPRVGGKSMIGAWVRIMIYDRVDHADFD